ncbi:MAG: DNA repair protein RadA [Holosporaceae bacterium]|jgi:DNA repair protein RadA/Sms|nr:DNA repair protein RadA [Holosporaceae bacterium]
MAKNEKRFYCSECGAVFPRWLGRCEDCGQWNTIVEDVRVATNKSSSPGKPPLEFIKLSSSPENVDRKLSDIGEFDRVLGGGMVPGSVVLIGGDPGIGKSTLLLQVLAALSQDYNCVYISGEESADQICLRASRLGASDSEVKLACETDVDLIIKSLDSDIDFLVIDSIQTLHSPRVESTPGTVTQVRACTYELINFAKTSGTTVFLVGHVTKDGAIAGPKVLEHMVDTVLYFEGERGNPYRILRAVKNRYGPCDELGIFDMQQQGLISVNNPSIVFLTQRDKSIPGTTVFSGIEGTRPLLVEVQALVAKSYFAAPRRTVVGWDINRLFTVLAVIESKCKISFSDRDVYLSIAGGLKISEPAGDLAVALSLLSARNGNVVENSTCAFGEIGLTGEIRSVSRCAERLKEAEKFGFKNIILPASNKSCQEYGGNLQLIPVRNLSDLITVLTMNEIGGK